MSRIKIACFVIFILPLLLLSAKDLRLTPYSINASLDGAYNLYSSSFRNLPGIENCCTNFSGGSGFGWGASVGLMKDQSKLFMIDKLRYGAFVSYKDISGSFREESKFANIIIGNSAVPGISEYNLKAKLGALTLEPSVQLLPFSNFPINFKISFIAALLINKSFEQNETLIQPENVLFENGTRIRNVKSGNIPDANPMLFGLSLAINYDLYSFRNYTVSPGIRYEYYLNNVVKNIDWIVNSLTFGIIVRFQIPKAELVPASPPPVPVYPEPALPANLNLALKISQNSKELNEGDTIKYKYSEIKHQRVFAILPEIYFESGSDDFKLSNENKLNLLSAQELTIDKTAEYLKSHPETKISLNLINLPDFKDLNEARQSKIKSRFSELGIDENRIKDVIFTEQNTKLFKHPELKDESQKALISFSDGNTLLYVVKDSGSVVNAETLDFDIEAAANSLAQPVKIKGEIYYRDSKIFSFSETRKQYSIRDNNPFTVHGSEANLLEFKVLASDAIDNKKTESKKFYIKPVIESYTLIENLNSVNQDSTFLVDYILGYFNFNESQFSYVDERAIEKVKKYADDNCEISIIPLTDSLGTEGHNINLARRRAIEANTVLGLKNSSIKVSYPESYIFDNSTIFGRIRNRAVIARVKINKNK